MPQNYRQLARAAILAVLVLLACTENAWGITALELQQNIASTNASLKNIDKQIKSYNDKIAETSKYSNSLKNELAKIDSTIKKLALEIQSTRIKIERSLLIIEGLKKAIDLQAVQITKDQKVLRLATQLIATEDSLSLFGILTQSASLSDLLDRTERLSALEKAVSSHLRSAVQARLALGEDKDKAESEQQSLERLRAQLNDQKKIADDIRHEQAILLTKTKNQEQAYKDLVKRKLAEKAAVEEEIAAYESQLKVIIDQSQLPSAKKGVLTWPLSSVRITQQFGNTQFAQTHSSVYNGKGHNGIDLAASIGTPVMAALTGVVNGVGDTDITCSGASYGKWVLIEHQNGLSTLYAHLSLVKALGGQLVATNELIGYAGQTGYATGPHLHFSVFATQGVKIDKLRSRVPGCGTYTLPIASLNSYLNPEEYL